jgi:hypothetical protein
MIIKLTAAATVVPLTALMFSACLSQRADDQQVQPQPGAADAPTRKPRYRKCRRRRQSVTTM